MQTSFGRRGPLSLLPLDISVVPLEGMNLIEASAGTGKTRAITLLYVRLILERNISVKNILVVTYTRAATHELRMRIRKSLKVLLQSLVAKPEESDQWVKDALNNSQDRVQAQNRIRRALTEFDEAAILTIHGFCQRVLADTAFESSYPFETEILSDETEILTEVVNDVWRREIYSAPRLWVSWLQRKGISTPDDLANTLKQLIGKPYLIFEPTDVKPSLPIVEDKLTVVFQTVADIWSNARDKVTEIFETDPGLKRNYYPAERVRQWASQMDLFLSNPMASYSLWRDFKQFDRFRSSILVSGRVIKKDCHPPRHDFFEACEKLAQCFENLEEEYRNYYPAWLRTLLKSVNNELSKRKSDRQLLSYDDLLVNLKTALEASDGNVLAERVRQDYLAVLVDEFQDTDPVQYRIFSSIYRNSGCPFFMVGDPKQAIYSFRGADIFAYLKAREHAKGQYALAENFRSVGGLVNAVNKIFSSLDQSNTFLFDEIYFSPTIAVGKKPEVKENNKRIPPLVIWPILRKKSQKSIPKYYATDICVEAVGAEVVRILSTPVTLGDRVVQPSDIAILVRTHHEGAFIETVLKRARVPAIRHIQESVYQTDEAEDLERVLLAISQPNDTGLMRAALLSRLFGHDVQEILSMFKLDQPWNDIVEEFHRYRDRWVKYGFMRMFRELSSREKIVQRILALDHGERRLTNLLHLSELIGARFGKHHDIDSALRWLSIMRESPPLGEMESLVRLESDQDRVRIMTLHSSKGLQFPIVFLPFLWGGGLKNLRHDPVIFHDVNQSSRATVDLGSENFEINQTLARDEELAESLRLLYVGVTRAESRCYIAWGAVKGADTSALAWLLHRPAYAQVAHSRASALHKHFSTLTDADLMASLNNLSKLAPADISIQKIPTVDGFSEGNAGSVNKKLTARKVHKRLEQAWALTSFSGLTAGKDTGKPDHDSLSQSSFVSNKKTSNDIFSFPRGAQAGICIHRLFEEIDFSETNVRNRQARIEHLLKSYGFEARWTEVIDRMLLKVLDTPLDSNDSLFLSRVKRTKRIDEMAFYYPISTFQSSDFNELLIKYRFGFNKADGQPIKLVNFETLPGFMNGYIDLVFEAYGQFWIVDYKSNYLGDSLKDYQAERLEGVIAREQYSLQYLIYTLAVHRYLGQKMVDYEYDRHFGGVYYLFVRGMEPSLAGNGVFFDRPSKAMIEDLDKLLWGHVPR
jgi:exodeoxyribonuclease V beta subunit